MESDATTSRQDIVRKVTYRISEKNYQKIKGLSKEKGLSANSLIEALIAKAK